MGHVYVAASGYSKQVVPATSPYEFAISADGSLVVTLTSSKPFPVRRIPTEAPVDGGDDSDPVADVIDGPDGDEWWLDARVYRVPLPRGWTAVVTGHVAPAFFLVQNPDRSVFVQTAQDKPTIDDIAAGRTETARGADGRADWIEVSYLHEGREWLQRHSLMHGRVNAMITGQAPADAFVETRALQMELVRRTVLP